MPAAVLALDQGTTGSTALVFGPDGAVLGRSYAEFTQHYPAPGWVEHDPEELWQVSRRVMAEALRAARLEPADLKAIGIANQRETTVVWDRETGEPIQRAIVWQSRQTAEICNQLTREGHASIFRARTGLVIDPYFSGTKIRWMLDRHPAARSKAEDGRVVFGTVDTWLLWKLTGELATEPTNASRTLIYDIHRRAWDSELAEILGVPMAMLPAVRPSSGVFGETRPLEGIPGGVPVAGMAGDQQAALYGQGCWTAGMAKNTYGTGCFVIMNQGADRPVAQEGLITTLCCDADGQLCYAMEGSIFVAGAAVQWLRDEVGLVASAAETEPLALSVPDSMGVYLVPAFAGLGAPYWDPDARGAIVGLTRGARREHLVRAALESMAYQTRDVVEVMNRAGVRIAELRVDGGAAANAFLMQFQADQLGVSVHRPRLLETTAAGAAFLAGRAVGVWPSADSLAGARRPDRVFEPSMDVATRDRLYAGWREAVARVRWRPDF